MVTAKATPRPSPRKSKAMPQHQAARVVEHGTTKLQLALLRSFLLWRKAPSGSGGPNTEHMLGDLKKHVKNDERLRRYQHAALSRRHAKKMIWRNVWATTLSKRRSRRWKKSWCLPSHTWCWPTSDQFSNDVDAEDRIQRVESVESFLKIFQIRW